MALSIAASKHWLGNDGPWSTFRVIVGDPPQELEVLPASQVSLTLVVLEQGCPTGEPASCDTLRGNVFDTKDPTAWQTIKAADGEPYMDLQFPAVKDLLPEPITSQIGTSNLTLDWFGNISADNQAPLEGQLIAGYAAKVPFLGLLGLSGWAAAPATEDDFYNSTLQTLKNNSAISGLTWGYTAGAKYHTPETFGSLTFGGYDSARINMDEALTDVPFTTGNRNELTLLLETVTVGDTNTDSLELYVLLDSMVPDIWLPGTVCNLFAEKFDLQWNNTIEMYMISDDQRERLKKEDTSVTFTLASTSGPDAVNITLPYSAFDHEAKFPLANITDDETTLYYFPLKRMPNETTSSQGFLGRTFFQEAYVSADYEKRTFNVGQALFPKDSRISLVPIYQEESAPVSTSKSSLSAGAIAGIAVGAFLPLSIIAVLAWWTWRRRRRERLAKEARTIRAMSVDEITLAALDPDSADRSEYYKPPQELVSEVKGESSTPAFAKHELEANATATGPTGQQLERHELEAGNVQERPGHRHNLSFGSSQSGISPMGAGDRISDVFGEPSPPMALSDGSPSPPLSSRRHESHGSPFPRFEMP